MNLVAPGHDVRGPRSTSSTCASPSSLSYSRAPTMLALDVYNALNSSAVLTYDNTFVPGGTWLQPLTILTPRFFKITADVDF